MKTLHLAQLAFIGLALASAAPAGAQERRLTAEEIAALPTGAGSTPGVTSRILLGDPSKEGPYALALNYPPGLEIKPHLHRDHRNAVVVKGSIQFGYGAVADRAQTKVMRAGSYYTEAAETPHFGFVGPDGLTLYLTGWGPSDTRPLAPAK